MRSSPAGCRRIRSIRRSPCSPTAASSPTAPWAATVSRRRKRRYSRATCATGRHSCARSTPRAGCWAAPGAQRTSICAWKRASTALSSTNSCRLGTTSRCWRSLIRTSWAMPGRWCCIPMERAKAAMTRAPTAVRRGRRFGVTFSCRRKAISRLHSAAVRDIVPLRARGVCEARTGALASKSMIHRLFSYALAAFAGLVIAPAAAQAHPHIWVTVKSEVVYGPDGTVTGVRHAWTFDDMFSVFATQGIESKKKGEFTREELAPLAEVNVTSLKEFDYFTYAKANGKKTPFNGPVDYFLDYKDSVLTLHFTLPFKAPVKTQNLDIEVFDPSYFVDFSFAEKDPVALVQAPAQCRLATSKPGESTPFQTQRLHDAMANQPDTMNFGAQFANKISVKC